MKKHMTFKISISSKVDFMILYVGIAIMLTSIYSCKKFIDIDPPTTQITTNNVFTNPTTATAAQTVIYSQMQSLSAIAKISGMSSDELVNYSSNALNINLYRNGLLSTNGMDLSTFFWAAGYNYIYQANAVIEGLSQSTSIDPKLKSQLIGEAKFIRAYWHYYLTNFYGDIPVVTSTNYKVNIELFRQAQTVVYTQIIADLKDALNLLNPGYVDANGDVTITDRSRPNRWAAVALLSRVYLCNGQYKEAEEQASSIIENISMYKILDNIDQVFLTNSKEAIWQIQPRPGTGFDTYEGRGFILDNSPENTDNVSLSQDLLGAFEAGDKRNANWIGNLTVGNKSYSYPFKYKIKNVSSTQESSVMLRLAEQYLIRAEARIQNENISGGIDDLNTLRTRARAVATALIPNPLPNLSTTLSKDQALKAVAHERQVELFTEGDRWFNLKRTLSVDDVMKAAAIAKGGIWKHYQQFYPIPESDILNSKNLVQTSGY